MDEYNNLKTVGSINVYVYVINPADSDFNSLKHRPKGSQEAVLRVMAFSPGREIIISKCSGNLIVEA